MPGDLGRPPPDVDDEPLLPEGGPLGLPAPQAPDRPPPPTRRHRADARAGDGVRAAVGRVPAATPLTRHTTDLGSMYMVVTAAATLWHRGDRRAAAELAAAGTLGWVVAQEVKNAFDRPRPYQAEGTRRLIPEPTGSSMPSGHSAVVAAATTVLAARSRADRRWPWPLVALWVPMTRIHLGVHYPSDTVVGLALGHLLGRAVIAASTAWRRSAGLR